MKLGFKVSVPLAALAALFKQRKPGPDGPAAPQPLAVVKTASTDRAGGSGTQGDSS